MIIASVLAVGCGDPCVTDDEFFEAEVAPLILADCAACHVAGGAAQDVWTVSRDDDPQTRESNQATFEGVATLEQDGIALVLLKPTETASHEGGQRFEVGSEEYDVLLQWVNRVRESGGCSDPGGDGGLVECGTGEPVAGEVPLRRMTGTQFARTVEQLFPAIGATPDGFPETFLVAGYSTYQGNNTVTSIGAEQIMKAAEAVSEAATVVLETLLGCEPSDSCVEQWIETFGRSAYRRPLVGGELEQLAGLYDVFDDPRTGVRAVIEAVLQSPQFLYLDVTAETDGSGLRALDDYALATKLAYLLTDRMPDDELLAAAARGELTDPAVLREQAERLIDHDRWLDVFGRFHGEWIQDYRLGVTFKEHPLYHEWGLLLLDSMRRETTLFAIDVVWLGDRTVESLLTSREALVDLPLAQVYGVSSGSSGPQDFRWIDLPSDERAGILTRTTFLAANSNLASSNPVKRGVFVANQLLCHEFAPPDDLVIDFDATDEAPETVAEELAAHRADPTCAACHDVIDPIGMSFENYGVLGEWREVYDNGDPIEPSGQLPDSDESFAGAVELSEVLAQADRVRDCYAEHWMRYALGRPTTFEDRCSLEQVQAATAAADGDIRELVLSITLSDSFRFHDPRAVTGGSE